MGNPGVYPVETKNHGIHQIRITNNVIMNEREKFG